MYVIFLTTIRTKILMLSLSHQVVSDCDPRMAAALQTRLPPLPPRACSNSCLLCWWCHPTISSSLTPFSSCLQSFPASGSCPMSWFFAPGDQNIRASSSASVLPMIIQGWFPLELTGLISLLSKGLSRVFSNITIWKHSAFGTQFFGTQTSLWSNSHIRVWLLEKP